tara:strand:+ start:1447 stop:2412 length:966 start_codon:yes stop_codon:yes gene_type:complete
MKKNFITTFFLTISSIILAIIFCEIGLRIKHSLIINYDIEMWKYAKVLKTSVENKKINHTHIPNKTGNFQNVEIKTNNFGQRDIEYNNDFLKKYDRSFLIIGSSIPLGWGVKQDKTYSSILNKISKENNKKWLFINGGVGNYNTERYVNNYLENWSKLEFTDIIINYFVNDAEFINTKKTNFFVKYTHTGVVVWKLINSFNSSLKKENLVNYYKKIYDKDQKGLVITKKELLNLTNFCKKKKMNCFLVNMPDIHQLNPYKLKFTNEIIKKNSSKIDLKYFDLLATFNNLNKDLIWNRYNDPHPNEYAHSLIANAIFDYLNK